MMTEVKKVLIAKKMAKAKMNEKGSGNTSKLQASAGKDTDESENNDQVNRSNFIFFEYSSVLDLSTNWAEKIQNNSIGWIEHSSLHVC